MIITRKKFLQITGLSVAAAAGGRLTGKLAGAMQSPSVTAPETSKSVRWAMVVDLGKCLKDEGCTRCIEACDKSHNIPVFPDEAHQIKWIWKDEYEYAFPSDSNEYQRAGLEEAPVPLLCNHCANPPCVRVCPTQATWQRGDGIVMMDWHRCIGCRYCMAACPYGSRSFNWTDPRSGLANLNPDFPTRTKGVVEKCNFCEERIAEGKQPSCVEACPEGAMFFGDLNDPESAVRRLLQARYTIRRKPELGTNPQVYYIV